MIGSIQFCFVPIYTNTISNVFLDIFKSFFISSLSRILLVLGKAIREIMSPWETDRSCRLIVLYSTSFLFLILRFWSNNVNTNMHCEPRSCFPWTKNNFSKKSQKSYMLWLFSLTGKARHHLLQFVERTWSSFNILSPWFNVDFSGTRQWFGDDDPN